MGLFDGQFKAVEDWKWKHYSHDTEHTIEGFISKHPDAEFYIGTDSQRHSSKKKGSPKYWKFTTCLVAYTRRKGGNAIISDEITKVPDHLKGKLSRKDRLPVLRERLLYEATRSIHVGWQLNKIIRPDQVVTIHLDVNPNLKWDSSRYKDELVGYVAAQGFDCEHKPNAWAASWAADNKC